jgi:hypothetical protein
MEISSLKTAARERAKYKIFLVSLQEIRQYKGGIESTHDHTFLCRNDNYIKHLGTGDLLQK